jgi:hypothetical protein
MWGSCDQLPASVDNGVRRKEVGMRFRSSRASLRAPLLASIAGAALFASFISIQPATAKPRSAMQRPPALHVNRNVQPQAAPRTAAAPAGSLVYYKNGNIFVSGTDGTNARQVTSGGDWLYASMADNGTLVAEGAGRAGARRHHGHGPVRHGPERHPRSQDDHAVGLLQRPVPRLPADDGGDLA